MKSFTTDRFRSMLQSLPEQVQRQSKAAYKRFKQNPNHPGLRFKPIHATKPIYSVRISRDYRAVGVRDKDEIVWFWIGSHTEYEKLISQLYFFFGEYFDKRPSSNFIQRNRRAIRRTLSVDFWLT